MFNNLLVTGGAGFIGSAFIRFLMQTEKFIGNIVNYDLLTYAADPNSLSSIEYDSRYTFVKGDICDKDMLKKVCVENEIDAIIHFAAESHVDRSISKPEIFLKTNIEGTFTILEVVKELNIHIHHVSTDEVYGSLGDEGFFTEESPYRPNSPYSASKAASDHFVRSYIKTYGISATISHCANNYGPFQFREKFIPSMIFSCINKKPFPVYGKGENIRDWLFVEDHVEAIYTILQKGEKGQVYDIGSNQEKRNIDLLHLIIEQYCNITKDSSDFYYDLITYVEDRKGHDYRYAIDGSKMKNTLNWQPKVDLITGLQKTIHWYIGSLV